MPSTSVHTVETTGKQQFPASYNAFLRVHCESEFNATLELYRRLDSTAGYHYTDRLFECRSRAWFARHEETGEVRVSSNQCRLRWCPLCARAKTNYLMTTVGSWLKFCDHPKFLTLTLKHSDAPLASHVNHLYQAFRQLRKAKLFKEFCTGGIWFFQIKKTKATNEWHPHLHCIITGKYIPQHKLSKLWLKVSHTSHIVDIRSVRDPKKVGDYVARYSARPCNLSDLSVGERMEVFFAMHGRRLVGTWGTARKLSLKPEPCPDAEKWENIGSWSVVTQQCYYSQAAKEIMKAWLTNNPLPPNVSCLNIDAFLDGYDFSFLEDYHWPYTNIQGDPP